MGDSDYEYFAFVSYSHRDARWARWLHRGLESYRLPTGVATAEGGMPSRRITPVFRDRDELAAADDLSASIERALGRSRFLIVLCSPDAAASPYVNAEIEFFLKSGGTGRVLAMVIGGEPPACFPPALTGAGREPIAADARPEGDGRGDAKLKLIAGMLGVGLDVLKRREARRQRIRLTLFASMASAVALAMGALAVEAMRAREDAEKREGEAVEARAAAERAEVEARATLSRSRFLQADDFLMAGDSASALAVLAEAVREDPGDRLLRARLHALLGEGRFAVPLASFHTREPVYAYPPHFFDDGKALFDGERRWNLAGKDLIGTGADLRITPTPKLGLAEPGRYLLALPLPGKILRLAYADALDQSVVAIEHGDEINDYAFSPDGTRLVTGSDDGTAGLWAIPSGARIGEAMAHRGDVTVVAFTPDGDGLLTASEDGTARRWDGKSGAPDGPFRRHPEAVVGAVFSPDGERFATWTRSHVIRVWEGTREEPEAEFVAHGEEIMRAVFDATGDRLATASRDGTAKVWDVEMGYGDAGEHLLFEPVAHPADVFGVAFSPDGRRLVTAAGDARTRVFELCERTAREPVEPGGEVLSPGGGYAYARFPGFKLRRVADGLVLPVALPSPLLSRDSDWYGSAVFAPDESVVVTLHADGRARVWDLGNEGTLLATVPEGGDSELREVVISPDSREMAVVTREISRFDLRSGKPVGGEVKPDEAGFAVDFGATAAYAPEGTVLAAGFVGGKVQLWDLPADEPLGAPLATAGAPSCLAFSAEGDRLLIGTHMGEVHVRLAESGAPAADPRNFGEEIVAVAVRGEIGACITRGPRATYAWHVPTGRLLAGPIDTEGWEPSHVSIDGGDLEGPLKLRLRCLDGVAREIVLDPGGVDSNTVLWAQSLAGRRIDPESGVIVHGVPWPALRTMAEVADDKRPMMLSQLRHPILGEWSFEDWIDSQLPPSTTKGAFALAERFADEPLVQAGLSAYFAGAEWPEEMAEKMRALAPDSARIAQLEMSQHPLTCYWLAQSFAYRGELKTALRYARLAARDRPEDGRFRSLLDELEKLSGRK